MKNYLSVLGVFVACSSLIATAAAQDEGTALLDDGLITLPDDGLITPEDILQGLRYGTLSLRDLRKKGLLVFTTPFNTFDGLGDGPFDPFEDEPGRPTLQGNGQFLRVNGLDAQSCNECHSLVSHRTRPPTLGIGGVGGVVQNAIIRPTLIDVADLQIDGEADYNGRFANPPFLFGSGGVELLAKEMTADLQQLKGLALQNPGRFVKLVTHGVSYGRIRYINGRLDTSDVEGIDEDLVVRPFGRKGENFSIRDFARGAMQFHFGMQPVEVVGENVDADGDGVANEVTVGEMTALHIFGVTNPRPFMEPLDQKGRDGAKIFRQIGCAACHIPVMKTRSPYLPLSHPEDPKDPFANDLVYLDIDLREVGFEPAPGGGVYVPLFADLKRHHMGPELEEDFERAEIPNAHFTTARLWGVADTAPYLHDGRATTLSAAILAHGGEAQQARDKFANLSFQDRQDLLNFLLSLRTPKNPNEDLVVE